MYLAIAVLTAFVITFILLPVIIRVSKAIDILDVPDLRKIHVVSTPSLGGLAIFSGVTLAVLIAVPFYHLAELKFFLCGLLIIFLLGIRDDISSLRAIHKLFIQLFAAFLVVYFTDIRLTGLYGMFGIEGMPYWFNLTLTIFVIVALTNSFNLIDGIDGLAASVAIFILSFFGWLFLSAGETAWAIVCVSVIGALVAFIFYNWHPSRIFMGDTGSLVLGFIVSTLAIKFINIAPENSFFGLFTIHSSVAISIGILILPIYDTLRVFAIRFLNGRSPLDPDNNHLHHGLLKLGMNHANATFTLLGFNALTFSLCLFLDNYLHNGELILIILGIAMIFGTALDVMLYHKKLAMRPFKVSKEKKLFVAKTA